METYVKIRGTLTYLYRAVESRGQTVDFRLSPKRDVAATKAFFRKAFKDSRTGAAHDHSRRIPSLSSAVRELRAEDRK